MWDACARARRNIWIRGHCCQRWRRKAAWGALAEHLSLNLCFLPHLTSCSAPERPSDLGSRLRTQMSAAHPWLHLHVFPSRGMLSACGTHQCSERRLAGEEMDAPFPVSSCDRQELSQGKKKCVGLWLLVSWGQSRLLYSLALAIFQLGEVRKQSGSGFHGSFMSDRLGQVDCFTQEFVPFASRLLFHA